jgi:hypothetical protein
MNIPNLPVPDELADVRSKLKALEQRELELKQILIADPSARTGAKFLVEVFKVETRRTDIKALREMYPAIADEHTYPTKTTRVELRALSEDGEITRPQRKEAGK